MTNYDLHYLELIEVAHLIQTRKLSPVELTCQVPLVYKRV